jgi:hypothetical protein
VESWSIAVKNGSTHKALIGAIQVGSWIGGEINHTKLIKLFWAFTIQAKIHANQIAAMLAVGNETKSS